MENKDIPSQECIEQATEAVGEITEDDLSQVSGGAQHQSVSKDVVKSPSNLTEPAGNIVLKKGILHNK